MKKILGKFNETGTLLVEAMAMLGLIAMVTPVLYKKAAERTVELQDVNASSQLRALSSAVDSYIKDNFAKITQGETIDGVDYGSFAGATSGTVGPIALSQFADYLPYGFLNNDGTVRETKLFTNGYQVWIKMEADYVGAGDNRRARSQILTGFISAVPKNPQEIGQVRASRIASMVGSNGGYVTGGNAMGAQGIWSVPTDQFPRGNLADNTFVISSLQPISSQGLANEDVLHRKDEPDNDQELNTMETDLFMGSSIGTTRNIRMVNQMIMSPDVNRMVGSNNEPSHIAHEMANPLTGNNMNDLTKTLYISRGGGAYIEGTLNAMNSLFSVDNNGINLYGSGQAQDGTNADGTPNMVNRRNPEPTFKVNETSMVYGNPGAGNAKLTVNSRGGTDNKGSMSFGASAMPADATAGTAAVAASESLFADKENFKAGDGTLTVNKNANGWATVIGKDAAGAATAHEGGRTTYTWNNDGVPTEGAEKTGRYEVSINGSAFVKDTMLTGKLKSYNVDAATLRAGVDPANFNRATKDTDFYTITERGTFIVGKSTTPVMTISEEGYTDAEGRNIEPGVVIRTTADASLNHVAEGIDIAAGDTGLPSIGNDYVPGGADDATQPGSIRIGAKNGVYLTAYDEKGELTGAPVSIQGDMFRAYKNRHNHTVDTFTTQFNLMSRWMYDELADGNEFVNGAYDYFRKGYERNATSWGRVYIADSDFIMADYDGMPFVDIFAGASGSYTKPTSRFSGGFAIYDPGYDMINERDNAQNSDESVLGDDAAVYINKGRFEIRTTEDNANKNVIKREKIFTVDNNKDTTKTSGFPDDDASHGSVYIRKGSINLATASDRNDDNQGGRKERLTNSEILSQYSGSDAAKEKAAVGYIAADRFISQFNATNNNVFGGINIGSANLRNQNKVSYDHYEVNPAYTSVMHDIKLTTRGGARLSDILPDFINKGIYVVDNTFDPGVLWEPDVEDHAIPVNEVNDSADNEVSAYTGFIPTPKCPPGYAKVATLTPSGWAMAQAGTPVLKNGAVDIMTHNNPMEYLKIITAIQGGDTTASIDDIQPLTYQKSTWLKAMVLPYCNGRFYSEGVNCGGANSESFKGWGAILGFIYPQAYFKDFIDEGTGNKYTSQGTAVYWNLFPVHYRELEGYATVYCYFDRKDATFDGRYVDKAYDQLKDYEADVNTLNSYEKTVNSRGGNAQYMERLNDPDLKYDDPW